VRVYVIAASDLGPSKIGISDNPEKRRRGLQIGHPEPLTVYYSVNVGDVERARAAERTAHRSLAATRAGAENEWFGVPPAEAIIVARAAALSVAALDDEMTALGEMLRRQGLTWLKSLEGQRAALDAAGVDSSTLDYLRAPDMFETLTGRCRPSASRFTFNDYLNTWPEGSWYRALRPGERRRSGNSPMPYLDASETLLDRGSAEDAQVARRWIEWSLARDLSSGETAGLAAVWGVFAECYTELAGRDPYAAVHGQDDQVDGVAVFAQTNDPSRPDRQCVVFLHEHFRAVLFPQRALELHSLDQFGRAQLKPLSAPIFGFLAPISSSIWSEPLTSWLGEGPKRRDAALARFLGNPAKRYPQLGPRTPIGHSKALAVVHNELR
jgi:hypothetical protein